MNSRDPQSEFRGQAFHVVILIVCMGLLALSFTVALAQEEPSAQSQEMTTTEEAPKLSPDQLDSLVAPIALFPDPLLAQTLAASTYPLEVMQLDQWIAKNPNLKDKALADAVSKQPWDASVQGMVAFPDVVKRMSENVQWTTDIGNAFLAQQSDVMDAVQRMRGKAEGTGNLKTSEQQTVQTKTVEGGKQVITIEQANPDVVYVPSYDQQVVYGPASAEYPYYNHTYPGYVPGSALAWGAGVAVSAAAWGAWGGHWGDCDWDNGEVNVNNNYNFNKNANKNVNRQTGTGQGNKWQHNPQHRGGTPYANKAAANKYGGAARGEARQPTTGAGKPGGPGGAGGVGGAGKPGGPGGAGSAGKPGGASGTGKASTGGAGKASGGGGAKGGGGGDKVGNHSVSSSSKGGGSAFGGGSSGSAAKASSNRGHSSAGGGGKGGGGPKAGGGPKGGGGAKAGGGRGGGGKGGGGKKGGRGR